MISKSNKYNNIDELISNKSDLNICIITHCYPPDFGAAPHQYAHMAESFHTKGHNVIVLTSHPYYPKGKISSNNFFKLRDSKFLNGVHVLRHWLVPSQKNSTFFRLLSMTTMLFSMFLSIPLLKKKKIDILIVQTPPITLPLLGLFLRKFQGVKLILNVSDLWPQAMIDLGSIKKNSFSYKALHSLEKIYYKNADFIITQSLETKEYIENLGHKNTFLYRIGADTNKFFFKEKSRKKGPLRIVYTGVLGVAHGILDLIKTIPFDQLNTELHLYGDGMEAEKIRAYIHENEIINVKLHPKVDYSDIPTIVQQYDVALISQKKYVKGTLPAKLYESLSLGIPVLFHGQGEGELLVKKHKCGLTSHPDQTDIFKANIKTFQKMSLLDYLELTKNARTAAVNFYDRNIQFSKFYETIKESIFNTIKK